MQPVTEWIVSPKKMCSSPNYAILQNMILFENEVIVDVIS